MSEGNGHMIQYNVSHRSFRRFLFDMGIQIIKCISQTRSIPLIKEAFIFKLLHFKEVLPETI